MIKKAIGINGCVNYSKFLSVHMKKFFSWKGEKIFQIIKSCPGREQKYYIMENLVRKNISSTDENSKMLNYAHTIELFNKMKEKVVLNVKPDDFENGIGSETQNKDKNKKIHNFLLGFFKIFDDKQSDIIIKRIENPDKSIDYFLDIKKSQYIPIIDNDFKFLRSFWPKEMLNRQSQFLNKKMINKINFVFVNEIESERNVNFKIEMEKPELIFGVSFIKMHKTSELIKKLKIDENTMKLLSSEKKSILLPPKIYAINPINDEKLRIVILNDNNDSIVNTDNLKVKACTPAHNEEDFNLAQEHSLAIKRVAKAINEMGDTIFEAEKNKYKRNNLKLNKNSEGVVGKGLILPKPPSLEDVKKELHEKMNQGPTILTEGFLINSKEFDFLFLEEARELMVNHLIRKEKAERIVKYSIDDWLIAKSKGSNSSEDSDNFEFTQSFISSFEYLKALILTNQSSENILSLDEKSEFLVNFKKWLPVDTLICNNQNSEAQIIFYSCLIHKILLNYLKDKLPQVTGKEGMDDEVFLNKEQELEKDVLFPSPFKEVLNYSFDKVHKEWEYKDLETNLQILHSKFLTLSKPKFNVEVLTDEKMAANEFTGYQNLIVNIYKEFVGIIEVMSNISPGIDKIEIAMNKLLNLVSTINNSQYVLSQHPNVFTFIYLNYLILLHPFSQSLSNSLFKEFSEHIHSRSILKKDLSEYSIEKLYRTCKFFIDMLSNSVRIILIINSEVKGKVLMEKSILNSEDTNQIISHLKEVYGGDNSEQNADHIQNLIKTLDKDKVKSIEIEDKQLKINLN